mmetsp:Transcript_21610/g.33807  ORF Transcript_21610/g.33807 Transcript_21610/m.33807 type:complete len:199 (+) Transcript_21610:192-788(+)
MSVFVTLLAIALNLVFWGGLVFCLWKCCLKPLVRCYEDNKAQSQSVGQQPRQISNIQVEVPPCLCEVVHVEHEELTRTERAQANTKILFHQTSEESAGRILADQRMLRGQDGLAGGGIYFALTREATNHKAQSHGVVLRCKVALGNVLEVSPEGDSSITFTNLQQHGHDSVLIPRGGGTEYVIYNWDQVLSIERLSEE